MDTTVSDPHSDSFLIPAAALLIKSSVSIVDRFKEDLTEVFSPDDSAKSIIYEVMAFLTSVVLHQAQAQKQSDEKADLNQTFHALKNALVQAAQEDASLLGHANHFDDQSFHDLIASYFKGSLEAFGFSEQEQQEASRDTGMAIPSEPGVDAIFFALLIRLIRVSSIQAIADSVERKKASALLTRLTETSISSFGLALQMLSSGRLDV